MKTTENKHIDFLDPVRGIAILAVFLYHALWGAFGRDQLAWGSWFRDFNVPGVFLPFIPLTFGWVGVAIFFVVSGFCIHLSFSRQPDWPLFFHRRLFRIYPPYLAALFFFALLYPPTHLRLTSWAAAWQFLSHFLLVQNFDDRTFFGINGSFWSIAVEAQLYALYPLLLALTGRLGWRLSLWSLAALEITLRLVDGIFLTTKGSGLPCWIIGSPLAYWFSWSLGVFLAERYLAGRLLEMPRFSLRLCGALAIVCNFVKPLAPLSFALFALLTTGALARLLRNAPAQRLASSKFWRHLQNVGVWSFSLYLLHQPILTAVQHFATKLSPRAPVHPLLLLALGLASWWLIVPIAHLSYRYLELPSIALGKRLRGAIPRSQSTRATALCAPSGISGTPQNTPQPIAET